MSETCPYCGRSDFANTKALGSHIHYVHENESWASISQTRSENDKDRFRLLLNSCLSERGLRMPRNIDKIEQMIAEIPEGISPVVDGFKDALKCTYRKEKLVKEIEKLTQEPDSGKTG